MARRDSPPEVQELYKGVKEALSAATSDGRVPGKCQCGVYAFRDYEGEPIYVGKTREQLGGRIRRHLTNRRSDAAAMHVLDPFEVAEICMWPFWDLAGKPTEHIDAVLARAEFTIYKQEIRKSRFGVVLNEREIPETEILGDADMPAPFCRSILSDASRMQQEHPDIRLARRAHTFAELARTISERQVQPGIRQTLVAQAQRLRHLADERLTDLRITPRWKESETESS